MAENEKSLTPAERQIQRMEALRQANERRAAQSAALPPDVPQSAVERTLRRLEAMRDLAGETGTGAPSGLPPRDDLFPGGGEGIERPGGRLDRMTPPLEDQPVILPKEGPSLPPKDPLVAPGQRGGRLNVVTPPLDDELLPPVRPEPDVAPRVEAKWDGGGAGRGTATSSTSEQEAAPLLRPSALPTDALSSPARAPESETSTDAAPALSLDADEPLMETFTAGSRMDGLGLALGDSWDALVTPPPPPVFQANAWEALPVTAPPPPMLLSPEAMEPPLEARTAAENPVETPPTEKPVFPKFDGHLKSIKLSVAQMRVLEQLFDIDPRLYPARVLRLALNQWTGMPNLPEDQPFEPLCRDALVRIQKGL